MDGFTTFSFLLICKLTKPEGEVFVRYPQEQFLRDPCYIASQEYYFCHFLFLTTLKRIVNMTSHLLFVHWFQQEPGKAEEHTLNCYIVREANICHKYIFCLRFLFLNKILLSKGYKAFSAQVAISDIFQWSRLNLILEMFISFHWPQRCDQIVLLMEDDSIWSAESHLLCLPTTEMSVCILIFVFMHHHNCFESTETSFTV